MIKERAQSGPQRSRALRRRYRAETRFKACGRFAILLALLFMGVLAYGIVRQALPALHKAEMLIPITFDPTLIAPRGPEHAIATCRLRPLLTASFRTLFPEDTPVETQGLIETISPGACKTLLQAAHTPKKEIWLPVSDNVNLWLRAAHEVSTSIEGRRLSPHQIKRLEQLKSRGQIRSRWNTTFLTAGDARNPEYAGIASALAGSLFLLLITFCVAFPIGVGTAVYLEEFAPKNRFSRFIEVNISNLAAVPSIVFGLLGLAVFLSIAHLPRSSSLVGGLTLALMTLPTIIIAARASLRAVPKTIRMAALGLGASQMQMVFHHVVPLATPGILTGTILSLARSLGETAPLLMIGMMAFITDRPHSPLDPSAALPVQIFTWARNPEPGFMHHAAAGILVLLIILVFLNLIAFYLRKKVEQKW